MHHKRGSSGIPHFFQKKLAFELGQYVDEKARLFISYYCRLYGLRITEQLFDIISTFHGIYIYILCFYNHPLLYII